MNIQARQGNFEERFSMNNKNIVCSVWYRIKADYDRINQIIKFQIN